jgi:hypothetical protein
VSANYGGISAIGSNITELIKSPIKEEKAKVLKKQARNGMALFLILMLIFADAYTISNLIAPPYRHAKRQDSPIEDNTTPLKVFQMGSLSKIYP